MPYQLDYKLECVRAVLHNMYEVLVIIAQCLEEWTNCDDPHNTCNPSSTCRHKSSNKSNM